MVKAVWALASLAWVVSVSGRKAAKFKRWPGKIRSGLDSPLARAMSCANRAASLWDTGLPNACIWFFTMPVKVSPSLTATLGTCGLRIVEELTV